MDFTGDVYELLTTGTAAGARAESGWGSDTDTDVVMGTSITFSRIVEGVDATSSGLGVGARVCSLTTTSGIEATTVAGTDLSGEGDDDNNNDDDDDDDGSSERGTTAAVDVVTGVTGLEVLADGNPRNPPTVLTVDPFPVCTEGHFLTPPEKKSKSRGGDGSRRKRASY